MKKYMIFTMILMCVFAVGCNKQEIGSFDECAAAGNPIMESYPRQCRTQDGKVFTEELEEPTNPELHVCSDEEKAATVCTLDYIPVCGDNGKTYGNGCSACASGEIDSYSMGECEIMDLIEAREIAENSDCTETGELSDNANYNAYTQTWWIELTPDAEKKGCNPACVVSEATKTAEINWRCTGLLE